MKIITCVLALALSIAGYAQPPKNITQLGLLNYPGQHLAGCWHYNDGGGKEYALVGASEGISIVDITDPTTPTELFQLPGVTSNWHEVRVSGDFAFAVSEGFDTAGVKNGMQVIDLRFLPDSAPNYFYHGDGPIANMLETAHSIHVDADYAFVNGHNILSLGRGVLILDISNPYNPVYLGSITNRYCHDSYYRDNILYTSDIVDGMFSVYDIADPANPMLLATQTTPNFFNHNSWLSDDSKYLFTTDERFDSPVGVFDISDLNDITLIDTFYNGHFTQNEVHNVRVLNDFLINPSYGSQVTIADASRPSNVIETGSFVTGNSLCWDADPYTASGNIIATDASSGNLYILAPEYIRACYLEGLVTDSATGFPIPGATVEMQSISITCSSDFSGNYRTGYADSGTYVVQVSKIGYDTKQLSAQLQNGVLTILNVELVPTNAGIQQANEESLKAYADDANTKLIVSTGGRGVNAWSILDGSGRLVMKSGGGEQGDFSVNISSLAQGLYTVELISGTNRVISRFTRR